MPSFAGQYTNLQNTMIQSCLTANFLHCWLTGLKKRSEPMQYITSMEVYTNKAQKKESVTNTLWQMQLNFCCKGSQENYFGLVV